MKIISYIFIFLNVLVIQNCKNTNLCSNDLLMFEVPDSIPKIKIVDTDSRDDIITKFQNSFGADLCYKDVSFGLQTSDKVVKLFFNLYCPIKTSHISRPPEAKILINQEGKILINSQTIIELNELRDWVAKDFTPRNDNNLYKKEITIIWNEHTPSKYLELASIELVKGLYSKFDLIGMEEFNEPFCKLSKEQASKVLKLFPYKLVFDLGNAPIPPPPPSNSE